MELKTIFVNRHYPYATDLVLWFNETFGDGQEWNGKVMEPTQLKKNYQWAYGIHMLADDYGRMPCIWCTERAYTLYCLRWL